MLLTTRAQRNDETRSLLFAFIILLDHLARHLLVVRKNQPRNLRDILVDLPELLFDFLLVRRGQRALKDFEVADVLMHFHLSNQFSQLIKERYLQCQLCLLGS